MVTLKLTLQTFQRLRECASLDEWAKQLIGDIGARVVKGVDTVVVAKAERSLVELAGPHENAPPPPGRTRSNTKSK